MGQNHSCDPNCKIFACYIDDADVDKPLLTVFTTREVEPWEELCFSYYGDIDVSADAVRWPCADRGIRRSGRRLKRRGRAGRTWAVSTRCMRSAGVRQITVSDDCSDDM